MVGGTRVASDDEMEVDDKLPQIEEVLCCKAIFDDSACAPPPTTVDDDEEEEKEKEEEKDVDGMGSGVSAPVGVPGLAIRVRRDG